MRKYLYLVLIFTAACQGSKKTTDTRVVGAVASHAMIVSAHPLATQAGLEILKNGGNAIDAAIATQFALAVVYPRAGNIGGGGFALIRTKDGDFEALDFREKAPELATRNMYLKDDGEVDTEASLVGHRAAGVPGSVAGMWALHQKYGTIEWDLLVQPAINLAFEGFSITGDEAEALNEKQQDFLAANDYTPWVIREEGWVEGDFVRQNQLAATLSFIRDNGIEGFYKGIVADQIQKEMQRNGGLITKEDLADYDTRWRTPVMGEYKGRKVVGMPPPSSGGIALIQLLQGAEVLDLGKYPHNSARAVHLMAELEKRVYADRARYLGDPDFFEVPVDQLIADQYNKDRYRSISKKSATPSHEIASGELMAQESLETTHFSIVDSAGNAVAITTTLNANYGSKVMVKGAGFFLNNEMDDFSAKPGVPNLYGLIGGEANAIEPDKRMLSSMTPTIVEKDGKLEMVLGSPGGSTIITSVFQVLINVADHQMTMQEAVNARRVHHQWLPDYILAEEGALSESVSNELIEMGHTIKIRDKIGRTDCILVQGDTLLEGGADYTRGDDFAQGF